jgi:hypothetical protein
MDSPAAIRGTFSDFRLIKGRKCAQIICEIPIEEADAALSVLGGIPQPASERWIALAPLNITSIKPAQEKRRFENLSPLCKRASDAMSLCYFWRYCGVPSRSNLNLDPKAAAKWQELDARYMLWLREPQHA